MHPTRREMLRLGLGSSALLACGPTVPLFLARSASALADDRPSAPKGRILVVVQLDGGNDGLNTVVPYRDDEYRKRRPRLAIPAAEVKKVDDHIGLHPSLEPFSKLLEQQRLAIVQGVGYPNPNRSHFDSMAIWQTARTTVDKAAPGWLARAIDRRPGPAAAMRRACTSTSRSRCPRRWRAAGRWCRRWRGSSSSAGGWACPRGRGRRADRGPRSPGAPGPGRARLAAPVRRAVQPDHVCQQRTARAGAAGRLGRQGRITPTSTAWPGGSA